MHVYRLKELLEMAGTTRAKLRVKSKTKASSCLLCECEAIPGRRGLCAAHYNQFTVAKRKFLGKRKEVFDREQVRAGKILDSRRGRHPNKPNPFTTEVA